jgi:addiction module HigA family antidote
MERQIERALRPGEFIYDRATFAFVSGLEQVANGIKELIASEPSRAAALCEAFLAGCHVKAEQLRDELGEIGVSLNELARALRVPMNRISAIVNGKRAITVDTAMRLARYFGTSPQY